MRSVVLLLVIVMIAFGFLLSDRLHAQEVIAQLQQENNRLGSDQQTLQDQLEQALVRLAQREDLIRELSQRNSDQEAAIRKLEQENASLKREVALLRLQTSLPDASSLFLFLPVVPASIAAAYLLVRSKKHARPTDTKRRAPRSTRVSLTDREVQEIIRLRRRQH